MKPRLPTLFRLGVALALGLGYLLAPRILNPSPKTLLTHPERVHTVTLTLPDGGGEMVAERNAQGAWSLPNFAKLPADGLVLEQLLQLLASAPLTPAANATMPADGPRLSLRGREGLSVDVELGSRTAVWRQQLVRQGGQIYALGGDLNALLGLWQRELLPGKPQASALASPFLFTHAMNELTEISLSTIFADYRFTRTPGEAVAPLLASPLDEESAAPRPMTATWRLAEPSGSPAKPLPRALENWAISLSQLGYSAILPSSAGRDAPPGISLRLTYSDGEVFKLRLSGLVEDRYRYLWTERHPDQVFLLDQPRARAAHRHGSALMNDLPRVTIPTQEVTAFALRRGGHTLELRRQGKDWQMITPAVSGPVWVPPAMPPMKPQSQGFHYLDQLQVIVASELFADDSKRLAAAKQALAKPAAEIRLALADGRTWRLALSPPLPGTDLLYLQANDEILVIAGSMTEGWLVNPAWFFDPAKPPAEELPW